MGRWRRSLSVMVAAGLAAALLSAAGRAEDRPAKNAGKKAKPKVEVVFCLDTTGSMGPLIEAAKQKIWSISNQIASGKPTPELKIGLVAYRDKTDAYVTRVVDLTDDLDAIHGKLRELSAQGGGDGPESVNQALDDSVNKIKWSTDKKTLRIIFLVGDAPPHMDYADDVKYPETCKKACVKGIIINSIQCGHDGECQRIWKDVCAKAEGSFAQIASDAGALVIATPYDRDLARINSKLAGSTVVYGGAAMRTEGAVKARAAAALPAPAAADRAGFLAKDGRTATYDLVDAVNTGKVKLDEVKKEELPDEMQKMSPAERKAHLEKLDKERKELRARALELDKKRAEYIKKELAKKKDSKDTFDTQVLETLRKQAGKYNIAY